MLEGKAKDQCLSKTLAYYQTTYIGFELANAGSIDKSVLLSVCMYVLYINLYNNNTISIQYAVISAQNKEKIRYLQIICQSSFYSTLHYAWDILQAE